MTTPSLLILMATTRLTTRKAGRRVQNSAPGLRSSPGHAATSGTYSQGASIARWGSYSPKRTATAHPEAIPMSGAHSRHIPDARMAIITATASVTAATAGPAAGGAPSGTSPSLPTPTVMTVTAISISAVPETTGAMTRLSSGSHCASANWTSDDTTMRLRSVGSPPPAIASTATAMKWGPAPVMSTCPAPSLPARPACSAVTTPPIASAENMAQDR